MRAVISILITLALIALALPLSSATSHTDFPDRPHYASWSAPLGFTGDIVIGFSVDFGEANRCTSFVGAGTSGSDGGVSYRMSGAHFGITSWSGRPAQIHHDAIDTRIVDTRGGGGVRMTSQGPLSGVHEVTMAVFDAAAVRTDTDDPWLPLEWALGCDEPFQITDKHGGREALGFTHLELTGSGASANAWLAGASINRGDTIGATFTAPNVTFDWFSYGNLEGTLALDTPEQDVAWDLAKKSRAARTGGPGSYTVTLDRVGVGMFDDLVGVFTATAPVASFDDIL